jgi:autophagy-related protein 101
MNLKEVSLEEMELHANLLDEGLSSLLHTILFVRAPGPVRPQDAHCQKLAPLTYAK